jgi:hypothetical protein
MVATQKTKEGRGEGGGKKSWRRRLDGLGGVVPIGVGSLDGLRGVVPVLVGALDGLRLQSRQRVASQESQRISRPQKGDELTALYQLASARASTSSSRLMGLG